VVLSVPRYPEFHDLHWSDQEIFYVPELEMSFGEICSAMRKSWHAYKWARREHDTENEEYYSNIIAGIIEGLGYRPMRFRIAEYYDDYPETTQYEPQENGEAQEVDEIEADIQQRRKMAVSYGKTFKHYDWNAIIQQYIRYIEPDDADDGYIIEAEGDDEIS
jgi:hypothetical protein